MKKTLVILFLSVFLFISLTANQDLALINGHILTITNGTIANGTVIVKNGKIHQIGKNLKIPVGIQLIDLGGKYLMPGLIDSHTHIALSMGDINEATNPVTPQVWMKDILVPDHDSIRTTLAGGVTTVKTMHGSANVIGGVNVTIKLKYNTTAEEMIIKGVRQQLKMALGENPKRLYGSKGQTPSTRMGTAFIIRDYFRKAKEYKSKWDTYAKAKKNKKLKSPEYDAKLETLKLVLEKKMSIDCHIYRADEMVWLINFCKKNNLDFLQISHCIEGYKVADIMAEAGVSFGGWADWWGYKDEAYDGCPQGFKIMYDAGVNMVINSDSGNEGRMLFLNAAKVLKYNDIPEIEILKMITINAAKSLELEKRIGSIEVGKDADFAIFDKHPLDSTTKCVKTIIEGKVYFDLYNQE